MSFSPEIEINLDTKADLTSQNGVLVSSQVPDLGLDTKADDLGLDTKADLTQSGGVLAASQVPDLGLDTKADLTQSGGVLAASQLPDLAITNIDVVADQSARLALNAEEGDVAIQTDINETFILSTDDPTVDSNWKQVQLDVLGAIDGQQITPAQTGTSSNPTTVVASSVTEDGNNVVTSPNADRDIYVIQSGASDPSAATNDDIILEQK